jgi:hypothetical protein
MTANFGCGVNLDKIKLLLNKNVVGWLERGAGAEPKFYCKFEEETSN